MTYTADQVREALERAASDDAMEPTLERRAAILRWLAESYARMVADAEKCRIRYERALSSLRSFDSKLADHIDKARQT